MKVAGFSLIKFFAKHAAFDFFISIQKNLP